MAEPVSSIVALATVSLAIIQKMTVYIQAVKGVHSSIENLQKHLISCKEWIETVQSTCRDASKIKGIPELASIIRAELVVYRDILKVLHVEVMSLASRKSSTFLHKLLLKVHSDRSKATIDKAVQDIDRHGDSIQRKLSCLTSIVVFDIHRQISEHTTPLAAELLPTSNPRLPADIQKASETETHPYLIRTLFEATTAFEVDFDAPSRRNSSGTEHSRHSVSSGPSLAPSPIDRTITETMNMASVDEKAEMEFHYEVQKCHGDTSRKAAIVRKLKESPALASSRNKAGRRPLHITAQFGDVELARVLLEYSADVDAEDTQSCSVLDMAIQKNQRDFVAFLLDRGAKESSVFGRNQRRLSEMKQTIKLQKDMCG